MDTNKKQYLMRTICSSLFSFLFTIIFGMLLFRIMRYWTAVSGGEFPLLPAMLLSVPAALLGMITGAQTTIFLQRLLGKKAEKILEKIIALSLCIGLFCWYQYVLVPENGLPPLTLKMLWEALLEKYHLDWLFH